MHLKLFRLKDSTPLGRMRIIKKIKAFTKYEIIFQIENCTILAILESEIPSIVQPPCAQIADLS